MECPLFQHKLFSKRALLFLLLCWHIRLRPSSKCPVFMYKEIIFPTVALIKQLLILRIVIHPELQKNSMCIIAYVIR